MARGLARLAKDIELQKSIPQSSYPRFTTETLRHAGKAGAIVDSTFPRKILPPDQTTPISETQGSLLPAFK